jgi:hypothetical protein
MLSKYFPITPPKINIKFRNYSTVSISSTSNKQMLAEEKNHQDSGYDQILVDFLDNTQIDLPEELKTYEHTIFRNMHLFNEKVKSFKNKSRN